MAPTVTRELSITYGGFTVGGATDYLLDSEPGKIVVEDAFDRARVQFHVLVNGTTEALFAAACAAVEAAFRKPFSDLVVTQGAATLLSLKSSDNTALEPVCSVRKTGGDKDTGRSRGYQVTFECGRPAGNVTDVGLRDFSVSIAFSPARRRTVTFSGTWTAAAGVLARAKYNALIDAKCTAALTAFGGSYKLAAEDPTAQSYHDQTLRFSRTYHESVYDQGGNGASGSPALREQSLTISRRRYSTWNSASQEIGFGLSGETGGSIGGGGDAQPLVELEASYSAWFDVGTALSLKGRWTAIETWLIAQMQTVLGGGAFALTSSRPSFDMDDNRITAQMTGVGVDAGAGNVLSRKITTTLDRDAGKVFDPVWTGNPTDVLEFTSTLVQLRTTRIAIETAQAPVTPKKSTASVGDGIPVTSLALSLPVGDAPADDPADPVAPPSQNFTGGLKGWIVIHTTDETEDVAIGINGTTIQVQRRTATKVERYRTTPVVPKAVPPGGGRGGGPVSPVSGAPMTA